MYAAGAPAGCARHPVLPPPRTHLRPCCRGVSRACLLYARRVDGHAKLDDEEQVRSPASGAHQMGGVARDDGVRAAIDATPSVLYYANPVTPDGGGGTREGGVSRARARTPAHAEQPAGRPLSASARRRRARASCPRGRWSPAAACLWRTLVVLVPLLLVELRGTVHDDGVAVDVEPKHGRRRGGGPLEDGAARHVGLLGRGLADEGDGRRGEQERAGELHRVDLRVGEF